MSDRSASALEKSRCTFIFIFFQTELDAGGDCSGANSGNCKTGLVCYATGNTCSEFLCLFVFQNALLF